MRGLDGDLPRTWQAALRGLRRPHAALPTAGPRLTWKTVFYRGALLRIQNRLYEQRKVQQQPATKTADDPAGAAVTALVLRTGQENADYIARRFGELRDAKSRRRGYHAGAYQRGNERGDVSLAPLPRLKPGLRQS